jgi:hypothetical protein
MHEFTWQWRDPSHLEAHRAEFSRSLEDVLEELQPLVIATKPPANQLSGNTASREGGAGSPPPAGDPRWVHTDWNLSSTVGSSGLRRVSPDGTESFWAYRRGRRIPSHLCLGARQPTKSVCLWGWWERGTFVIHTIYPGTAAPREIHDPEISLAALPTAIEFWRQHAIVVGRDEYTPSST